MSRAALSHTSMEVDTRGEAHNGIREVAEQRSADATVRKRFHWQRRRCRANLMRQLWLERRAEPRANMAGKWGSGRED